MTNFLQSEITLDFAATSTYGAILIPMQKMAENDNIDVKQGNKLKGKLKSAFKNASTTIKNSFVNVTQDLKSVANELFGGNDNGATVLISKFSGIAVAQAIIDGKVTSKEALDYLFMGFAPALGIQGSLMGYSGLNQLKDALASGTIDVGAFLHGFQRTMKGARLIANNLIDRQSNYNVIEIDLTVSHSESYQSETPDRRVQNGMSLNEYIHNMPRTIEVQCALQEGKRYSSGELRRIIQNIRNTKTVVALILGDEKFDNLVLTNFSPNNDCSKSGMDYTLSFKEITWSEIETNAEVNIQKLPIVDKDSQQTLTGSLGGGLDDTKMPSIADIAKESGISDFAEQKTSTYSSTIRVLRTGE